MRKTFVLTSFMFLIGTTVGFLDGRPTHLAIPSASAMIKGGGGGPTGCDGNGAAGVCSNCTGELRDTCTNGLCDGAFGCHDGPSPNGHANYCWTTRSGCHSGGGSVVIQ